MQEIYAEPVKAELIAKRIEEIKAAGRRRLRLADAAEGRPSTTRSRSRPGSTSSSIQGTVISAEHVSTKSEPLNLKEFIAEVAGARASSAAAPPTRPACT